jgi:1-phosphatidylinositol phosphodiesterase
MRRATTSKADPTRPLAIYEDEDSWNYLYDEPPITNTSPSKSDTAISVQISTATNPSSKIPLTSWITHLPSSSPLSTLSIPGTHNSCARILVPWVACQSATLTQQLHLGIRYFDFRLGITFGSLRLYHGKTPLQITLKDALGEMYAFLGQEKGECLILQVKHEGGDGDYARFEELFRREVAGNERMWATGSQIPRLGDVRGKIQLMRRFRVAESGGVFGIDVQRWADNSKRFWIPVPPGYGHLMVQDEYKFTNVVKTYKELIERKGADIQDLMLEARLVDTEVRRCGWYLNWCSAFAEPFSLGVVATPEQIALGKSGEVGINEVVRERIGRAREGGERVRVGTILLDFVDVKDPRVVQEVVMCNQFLEK